MRFLARRWRISSLVIVSVAAVVAGVVITHTSTTSTSVPPATSPATTAAKSPPNTRSTAPANRSTTSSTATTSGTTTPPRPAANTVLVPASQHNASWTSERFQITTGSWQLGWAYACSRATAGYPFQLLIVNVGRATAPITAVRDEALSDRGISTETVRGSLRAEVEEDPFCVSALKVVGVGS